MSDERIDVNVSMTEHVYSDLATEAAAASCSLSELVTKRLAPPEEPLLFCACGSAWFTLQEGIGPNDEKYAGAVALNASGSVAAWSGRIICVECGEHVELPEPLPPRPLLQLVAPRADSGV